jgi:spore maturation protein A
MGHITMNVAANMLGLGNAATPIGISAITAMEREQRQNGLIKDDTASRDMTVFIILNTASITLIPQTAASIRLLHGAARPFDIFPCVIVTTAAALTAGIIAATAANPPAEKSPGLPQKAFGKFYAETANKKAEQ